MQRRLESGGFAPNTRVSESDAVSERVGVVEALTQRLLKKGKGLISEVDPQDSHRVILKTQKGYWALGVKKSPGEKFFVIDIFKHSKNRDALKERAIISHEEFPFFDFSEGSLAKKFTTVTVANTHGLDLIQIDVPAEDTANAEEVIEKVIRLYDFLEKFIGGGRERTPHALPKIPSPRAAVGEILAGRSLRAKKV